MVHGGDIYRNKVTYDFSVNGNPFGPSTSVKEALTRAVQDCGTYPDLLQEDLLEAIAHHHGIKRKDIILGNGASELFLAYVHARKPKKVLLPAPSFLGYEYALKAEDTEIQYYYLKRENEYFLDDGILQRLTEDIDCLFLANPNNPVGNLVEPSLLQKVLDKAKQFEIDVILDECFLPFLAVEEELTMLSQYMQYPNLFIVRAFTKIYGIPGVRLGYGITCNEVLMDRMRNHLPEWNISMFAQYAGVVAIHEKEYVEKTISLLHTERKYLEEQLRQMDMRVFHSKANYIFFHTDADLYEMLLQEQILIRDCGNYKGLEKGYYRIAIKTHEENEHLVCMMQKVLSKK